MAMMKKRREVWGVDPDKLNNLGPFQGYMSMKFNFKIDVNTVFNFVIYETESEQKIKFLAQEKSVWWRTMQRNNGRNGDAILNLSEEDTIEFYINMLESDSFYKMREFFS